jgi:transcriptional regulator with XRE-family HTH domain
MEATSERMFDLRTKINIAQARLAKELGISQAAINRYEHNAAAVPDSVLLKYADFFDYNFHNLLDYTSVFLGLPRFFGTFIGASKIASF